MHTLTFRFTDEPAGTSHRVEIVGAASSERAVEILKASFPKDVLILSIAGKSGPGFRELERAENAARRIA